MMEINLRWILIVLFSNLRVDSQTEEGITRRDVFVSRTEKNSNQTDLSRNQTDENINDNNKTTDEKQQAGGELTIIEALNWTEYYNQRLDSIVLICNDFENTQFANKRLSLTNKEFQAWNELKVR